MSDWGLRALWATDGSENSHNAIPLLRQIVLPVATGLTVLSVASSGAAGAVPAGRVARKTAAAARQKALLEARQAAEHSVTDLDPATPVEVLVRWGHPVQEILRAVNQVKPDIIVMAAKGHSALRVALLGSVAHGVAQATTRPLLIARPGAREVRRVLVGFHGTQPARRALAFLDRLALPADAEIIAATVIEPFTFPEGTPEAYRRRAIHEAAAIEEAREAEARSALEGLASEIARSGRSVAAEVVHGQAAEALDRLAREDEADLIVVGSARPRPQGHFLLGATAERLVRHAHVSVLVVK